MSEGGGGAPVEGVQHLDDDECGESHGWGVVVTKDVAVDSFEQLFLHRAVCVVRLKTAATSFALNINRTSRFQLNRNENTRYKQEKYKKNLDIETGL